MYYLILLFIVTLRRYFNSSFGTIRNIDGDDEGSVHNIAGFCTPGDSQTPITSNVEQVTPGNFYLRVWSSKILCSGPTI